MLFVLSGLHNNLLALPLELFMALLTPREPHKNVSPFLIYFVSIQFINMNSFDLTIKDLSLFSTLFCKPLMEINLVINPGLDFLLQNWHQSHWPWKHSTFWSEICFEISAYFELGPAWNEDQLNQQVNEIQRAAKNGNPYRFPQIYVF